MIEMLEKIKDISFARINLIWLAKENHLLRCLQHSKPSIRGVVTAKKLKDKKIECYNFNNNDGSETIMIVQNGKKIGNLMHISNKGSFGIEIKYEESTE